MTQPSLMFLHAQIIPNRGASSFDVDNCFLETRNLSAYISFIVLVNWLRRRNDESFWSWRCLSLQSRHLSCSPWERTCHFSWRCKIKWIYELDKDQKKGVTGLRGMELFSSTSLSTVLMDVYANNGENMHSSIVKKHMVWVSRDKNIFTIPVL